MANGFEQTLARASQGDEGAIAELLERHLGALHAFVRLRAGDALRARESAADIVQSVCREVLADVGAFEFRGEGAFKAWLFTQALHKIIDRKRYYERDKRDIAREVPLRATTDDSEATGLLQLYANICSPSQVAMAREEVERVEGFFRDLPDDQREAVTLTKIVGLSYTETAEQMQRTEHSVRALAARGLVKLSEWMARRES